LSIRIKTWIPASAGMTPWRGLAFVTNFQPIPHSSVSRHCSAGKDAGATPTTLPQRQS